VETRFEPDLLAFDSRHRICYVIEVKDGDLSLILKSLRGKEIHFIHLGLMLLAYYLFHSKYICVLSMPRVRKPFIMA